VELTLVLGDTVVPKNAAVESALVATGAKRNEIEIVSVEPTCGELVPHPNCCYQKISRKKIHRI